MANLEPKKIDLSTINNGKKYENGDGTTPETFNAPIEASAYAQDFAEHLADTPDTSKANVVGTPNVEFIDNIVDGKTYKKFKFSNLKGDKGEKGEKGDKGDKGDNGNTTVNINNVPQGIVNFTSDPQTQIDTINSDISALASLVNGKLYAKEIPLGFIEIPSKAAEYPNITHADISADGFVPLFGILKYFPFTDVAGTAKNNKAVIVFPINPQTDRNVARQNCCHGFNGDLAGVCSISLYQYSSLYIYNYTVDEFYVTDVIYVGYYDNEN